MSRWYCLLILIVSLCVVRTNGSKNAQAQLPRRVLVEAFTNAGCVSCPKADSVIEQFESASAERVCVIKYHTSWPSSADPLHLAVTERSQVDRRAQSFYGFDGVPAIVLSGIKTAYPDSRRSLTKLQNSLVNDSPFDIAISQRIEGDSIHIDVKLTAVGEIPVSDPLALGVALTERDIDGKSNVFRAMLSGLGASGTVATASTLKISKGMSVEKSFTTALKPTWTRAQLVAVAFIQGEETREVYQSNWTIPNLRVSVASDPLSLPSRSEQLVVNLTSSSNEDLKLNAEVFSIDDAVVSVGQEEVIVPRGSGTAYPVNVDIPAYANDLNQIGIHFKNPEGLRVRSYNVSVLPSDVTQANVHVEDASKLCVLRDCSGKSAIMTYEEFQEIGWERFEKVYISAGDKLGIFFEDAFWSSLEEFVAEGETAIVYSDALVNSYHRAGNKALHARLQNVFGIEATPSVSAYWNRITDREGNFYKIAPRKTRQPLQTTVSSEALFRNEQNECIGVKNKLAEGEVTFLTFPLESINSNQLPGFLAQLANSGMANVEKLSATKDISISRNLDKIQLDARGLSSVSFFDELGRTLSSHNVNDRIELVNNKLAMFYQAKIGERVVSGKLPR